MEILETNSLEEFDKIHEKYFKGQFPVPSTANVPAIRNVRNGGQEVIASGFLKLNAEAVIVTGQDVGRVERLKAIDLLMKDMKQFCEIYGVEQVHAFVSSAFSRILINRYGFKHIPAVSLVLDLEGDRP